MQGCELEELQMEYNRKVMLRITSHVLGLKAGSLAYDDDIRQHMDMHKAAEISKLTQGAVSVVSTVQFTTLHYIMDLDLATVERESQRESSALSLSHYQRSSYRYKMHNI
jgi:hypothetical protein